MKHLAIIDLGSNSARLSIQAVDDQGHNTEIKRMKIMTRLAEGMGQSEEKKLQPQAIERTLAAIQTFMRAYQDLPDLKVTGIATAAVRAASNQREFLRQVADLTGVEVNVLSGTKEAYYDYLGVAHSLDLTDYMICDMGGGSFELVLAQNNQAQHLISIPYGAVSLSEKFHSADRISAYDLFRFQNFIQKSFDQLDWFEKGRHLPLVLLGGANRTVGRCKLFDEGAVDPEQMHGVVMPTTEFVDRYASWLQMSLAERRADLEDEADRADIIIGGLTPVVQMLTHLNMPEVIFSDSGVREGIIYEMLHE